MRRIDGRLAVERVAAPLRFRRFFFSSGRRHTTWPRDWSSDVCSSDLQPLAARMRPRSLADYVGQEHLLGAGKPLREAIERGPLHSMILWGPPGVGKTTLARLLDRKSVV